MDEYRIAIVGGGALGCASAYFLAKAGFDGIAVLERGEFCGATSAQAAGLVGQVRSSVERTRIAMESVRFFTSTETEIGVSADYRQTGSLRVALSKDRDREFDLMLMAAEKAGLDARKVDAGLVSELVPGFNLSEVVSAIWCPSDGYLQPNSLVNAYVKGARELGVDFLSYTEVAGIVVHGNRVTGIETSAGQMRVGMVVNAAGPWARDLAQMAGVDIPIFPVRHQYFVTEPVEGWHPGLPVLRIPDERIYVRAEGNRILCGGWEPDALSAAQLLDQSAVPITDWDTLNTFSASLGRFVPGSDEVGVRSVFKGYPAFTPDGRFVIGEMQELKGLFFAAGCNAHGVSGSAGLGQLVADRMQGRSSPYLESLSPDRFKSVEFKKAEADARSIYEHYYSISR